MNILFASSEEGKELCGGELVPGLGIFPGGVRKIPGREESSDTWVLFRKNMSC